MTASTTWPDREAFKRAVQSAEASFTDPELQRAQFRRGRLNAPMSWSGGRAMVFHATYPSGAVRAVRFLLAEDGAAAVRYDALGRHLVSSPVASLVPARWASDGVRVGEGRYPMLTMDWVDGRQLDQRLADLSSHVTAASSEVRRLAHAWRESCRALTAAAVAHGDIHAGNILVTGPPGGPVAFRLVDYDNVWVPGLDVPPRERGNPAFQHPGAEEAVAGRYADAFPNTLVYLTLRQLACSPSDWGELKGDDRLLFERDDLDDTQRPVWARLGASPDPEVRALTHLTTQWLRSGPATAYHTLEDVLSHAAALAHVSAPAQAGPPLESRPPVTRNVWPPVATDRPDPGRSRQTWPPRPPAPPPPAAPASDAPAKPESQARVWIIIVVAVLLVLLLLA